MKNNIKQAITWLNTLDDCEMKKYTIELMTKRFLNKKGDDHKYENDYFITMNSDTYKEFILFQKNKL